MAEPDLTVDYTGLLEQTGYYLGFGATYANYDSNQQALCQSVVDSGYRQFLYPVVLPGEKTPHRWSFLAPATSIDLTSGDWDYDLPDDFGELVGSFHYDDSGLDVPIDQYGEGQLMNLRAQSEDTGKPWCCAIRPLAFTGQSASSRFEVIFFPTPSGAYTIYYAYMVVPRKMSATYPYPIGGAIYAEALIASCLAVAERRTKEEGDGPQWQEYMRQLQAAIQTDRRKQPARLGRNVTRDAARTLRIARAERVSYEGTYYQTE